MSCSDSVEPQPPLSLHPRLLPTHTRLHRIVHSVHSSHQLFVDRFFRSRLHNAAKVRQDVSQNFIAINAKPPAAGRRRSHRRGARWKFAASCTLVTSHLTLWRCWWSHTARSANEASKLRQSTRPRANATCHVSQHSYVVNVGAPHWNCGIGEQLCFLKETGRRMLTFRIRVPDHLKFLQPLLQCSDAIVALVVLKAPGFIWLF